LALGHPTPPQQAPSLEWKQRKYFSATGKAGVFSVKVHRATGESRVLKLYSMASTKIERHIKVRGAANPYDARYT
jgi:RNA-directed DNA polymerase